MAGNITHGTKILKVVCASYDGGGTAGTISRGSKILEDPKVLKAPATMRFDGGFHHARLENFDESPETVGDISRGG